MPPEKKIKTTPTKANQVAEVDASSTISIDLLNNIPQLAILTLNEAFEVGYANAYACQLFGLNDGNDKQQFGSLSHATSDQIQSELLHEHPTFTLQFNAKNRACILHVAVIYNASPENALHRYALYITNQTKALADQEKLKHTEGLLKAIIDASPDYICIKDGNNRWLKANQKMLDLFEVSSSDYTHLTNHEMAKIAHPIFSNMLHYAEKSDEDTWSKKQANHHEETVFLPHGVEKTLEVTKIPSFGAASERENLVMFAHDISERKFIDQQLQNRSAILDALISCDWLLHSSDCWQSVANILLQQCCLALRFTRAAILKFTPNDNDNATSSEILFQWSTPGFMSPSKNFENIDFNQDALSRWRDILEKGNPVFTDIADLPEGERALLKQHDTTSIAIVPLLLDGNWWGNIIIERCYDADKTTSQEIGALMGISRSLSVAIQRESSDTRLNLAQIAFDSATEGMMIIDTNGLIVGINKGYTDITGYTEGESLGKAPVAFETGNHRLWEALSSEGKWCGEVINHRKNGDQYNQWLTITVVLNESEQVTNYVGVFADITEIKQSQEKLHELVNHDPLTGLPNRRLIHELFEHASQRADRNRHKIATLFIDLDRFKSINDSLGHQFGDKLLYETSTRIKKSIRESDVAGRLGGDEFIVIMDTINSKQDAENKARKILKALQAEFLIDGKEVFVTASIGIALFPDDGTNVDSVIKAADIAMYQVKNHGKNNFCFYAEEQSDAVVERFNIENQLRRALERDQFEVYYQPQIDLLSGQIIGAEALIRWQHPDLGLVSPDKFIPLAEETGLILQIGEWVLTQAAITAKHWVNSSNNLKHISVNVSGIQIMQSNFADTVYGVLVATDCEASKLELEITESTVMQNTEFVINTFNDIKNLGVGLAIDDFGTGYSSLSNLKRLPLDKLKIDRSFIRDLPNDLDDAAIANAIYAMAKSLGFNVIAEGVETLEQEDFLINMGCEQAQGYRYSKPISSHDFNQLMEKNEHMKGDKHAK